MTGAESRRLADLREEYTLGGLDRDDLDADPVVMLERWLADALFISVKTVSVHVTNILRKLDVRGRQEAARIAHRHGLGAVVLS